MKKLEEVSIDCDFFRTGDLSEIEVIVKILRYIHFYYRDKNLVESISLYRLLCTPKNLQLLQEKLCEEEEDHTEEEADPEEETVLVSSLDVADVISQVKER